MMRLRFKIAFLTGFLSMFVATVHSQEIIKLPAPKTEGGMPLMQALKERESGREFSSRKLSPETLSSLLWAAWGINRPDGRRTAPSAKNLQDIDVYVAMRDGLYLYEAKNHQLQKILGEDIRLSITSGDAPAARVDRIALEQAMMNLVINAREAMPHGGDVTVATDCAEVDAQIAARHEGVSAGRYAMLTISDTGVGMDEATRSQVFDPYFTTKGPGEGTGLGLAMVYGFVTQSGGFIDCQSQPGEGSVFRLYFPAVAEAVDGPPAAKTLETVLGGSETILLVEDDEPVRRVLVESLREAGYRVLETASAAEALPLGEHYEGRIDMLVTDVIMPGKDGVPLADRIRRIRPEIAVLYVTGYGGKELARHGLPDKDTHLLIKPFRHEELLIRVRQALEAPQHHAIGPHPEIAGQYEV